MSQSSQFISQTFGNFDSTLLADNQCLQITFAAGLVPQKQFWPNSSLSAKFISDYLAMFFGGASETSREQQQQQTEIKDAIRYIVNELLENAVKFSAKTPDYPTQLGLHIHADKIIVFVTNTTAVSNLVNFQALIHELTTVDPLALYIDRLEKNLDEENCQTSGLGFITILSNYATQIGWQFEPISSDSQAVLVTTMVQLSYDRQANPVHALAERQDGN
jgi:hypothetical protein